MYYVEPQQKHWYIENPTLLDLLESTVKMNLQHYEYEQPKEFAYATLLWTAYGTTWPMWIGAAATVVFMAWRGGVGFGRFAGIQTPLGFPTAFLAGANLYYENWRYILPFVLKVYGVDPWREAQDKDRAGGLTAQHMFFFFNIFNFLLGWLSSYAYRRFAGKKKR